VYGALHCALLLVITTPGQRVYFSSSSSFNPPHYFTVVEQLDRSDVDVVEKPSFMLLNELPNFIPNRLHLKVRVEVAVSDIPRCIDDVPKYLGLKSLNGVTVALFVHPHSCMP